MCKANPKAVQVFEAQLFPPFQEILQKDVLEFHPYVFQGYFLTPFIYQALLFYIKLKNQEHGFFFFNHHFSSLYTVLSLLLEQHGETGIPDTYMALYPFLLTPGKNVFS